MALTPGTRLGPYEVVAPLGEGGMGEVYRANDTRLGRTVALKVLGAETVRDPAARERFEREARLIARLQHPHICVLHDVGVEGDTPYLVMELLAGETLDARLTKGRLPLDDALVIAAQIAQALDAAHRQGIAHRDLKPANVMLVKGASRTDAKLLDFGVARPVEAAARVGQGTDDATGVTGATTAAVLTDRHTLVGTLPYMAPEQLAGQPADARTDLWALGCVLYEMLTGTRPFAGKTTASLMAAILEQPAPPLADRAPLTPPLIDHLVRRCLEKDPEHRWQSARDVALELDWARTSATATTGAEAPWQLTRRGLLVAAGGAVAGAAGGWAARARTARAAATIAEPSTFRIGLMPDSPFSTGLAISPDGRTIVVAVSGSRGRRLAHRRLDALDFQDVANSEDAEYPFFSPDGRWIGFFASNRLWRIPVTGGPREPVVESNFRYGATWMPDGTLVFATASSPDLMALPPGGREPTVLVPASAFDNKPLRWPQVAANGLALVFSVFRGSVDYSVLGAYRLDTSTSALLGDGTHPVPSAAGTLLYSRAGFIESATFDADALVLSAATRSTYAVRTNSGGMALLASAADGTVAWLESASAGRQVLARYALDGTRTTVDADPRPRGPASIAVSPDGTLAATESSMGEGAILVTDLERGATTVFATGRISSPSWAPDSRRLYFHDRAASQMVVRTVFSDAPATPVTNTAPGPSTIVTLRDGRLLLFEAASDGTTYRGRIVTPGQAGGPLQSFQVENVSTTPRAVVSPDGAWIAYRTGVGTLSEIRARRVDDLATWRPVTAVLNGTAYVAGWSALGIYYYTGRTVYLVPVKERTGGPEFGPPQRAFEMSSRALDVQGLMSVHMAPDGQSFVAIESADDTPDQLVVMLNGLQALRRS